MRKVRQQIFFFFSFPVWPPRSWVSLLFFFDWHPNRSITVVSKHPGSSAYRVSLDHKPAGCRVDCVAWRLAHHLPSTPYQNRNKRGNYSHPKSNARKICSFPFTVDRLLHFLARALGNPCSDLVCTVTLSAFFLQQDWDRKVAIRRIEICN